MSNEVASAWASLDENILIIHNIEIHNSKRTDSEWLKEYLGLNQLPVHKTHEQIDMLKQKLLTTGVFVSVETELQPNDHEPGTHTLHVTLHEKWTLIPVIRGAFGGGTGYLVAGVYNTHAFGRLWTLGAEGRKFENEKWGGVVWAKAPRWKSGNYSLGIEGWNIKRPGGHYQLLKSYYYFPIFENFFENLFQTGLTLQIREQGSKKGWSIDPKFIYDSIASDLFWIKGQRFILDVSPITTLDHEFFKKIQLESFHYYPLGSSYVYAGHLLTGFTDSIFINDQFNLGGLEGIRGIPDWGLTGNYALQLNNELRREGPRWQYLKLDGLTFVDTGWVQNINEKYNWNSSIGGGLRMSIPQVYRLMFRLDLAFSLKNPKSYGFSGGLNHFFDPYRPL